MMNKFFGRAKPIYNFCVMTKFTNEHEWVTLNVKQSVAQVGITDYA